MQVCLQHLQIVYQSYWFKVKVKGTKKQAWLLPLQSEADECWESQSCVHNVVYVTI